MIRRKNDETGVREGKQRTTWCGKSEWVHHGWFGRRARVADGRDARTTLTGCRQPDRLD